VRTLDPTAADTHFYRALVATTRDRSVSVWRDKTHVYLCASPRSLCCESDPTQALEAFAAAIDAQRMVHATTPLGPQSPQWCPLIVGWLSYDAMRSDEPLSELDQRPSADMAPYAVLLEFAAVLRASLTESVVEVHAADPEAERRLCALWQETTQLELEPLSALSLRSLTDREAHRDAILQVKSAIVEGEVYLVNVACVLHAQSGLSPQQLATRVFCADARYSAIIRAHGVQLGAMSMELGVSVNRATNTVCTEPIKGTAPRSDDPQQDARLAQQLESNPKERAENVMAVDVHRNDLGKIAQVGTVHVDALCAVESHTYVHHLVSRVSCKITDQTSTLMLLQAVCPVGSVTGAPKRAAMQMIANVEREQRGVYTGLYGAVLRDGSVELAVAIRTIVNDSLGAHYGCGGGIVYDSDPDSEWQELQWKQRTLSGKIPST
jgi:anthranilate/para-aminobenzoate synthase component I